MSGKTALIICFGLMLAGVALLTFVPTRGTIDGMQLHWVVPVAYFTMLVGAVGAAFAWFRKKTEDH